MGGSHIQVDYDQLTQIANNFAQEAGNIQAWVGMADGSVETLRASWQGDAANKFFSEWEPITVALNKLVEALNTASQEVGAVSKIFTEAEQNAVGSLRKHS